MTNEQLSKNIVDKIKADFTDRRGLRQEWDAIDEDIKQEIIETWENIALGELNGSQLVAPKNYENH